MKRLLLLVSVVTFAGAASDAGVRTAAPALERTTSNADGAAIFTSNRDGDADVYAVSTDGTGLTQLTNEPGDEYDPLPSPDGRHIVFQGGDSGLTVIETDGTGRRSLHDCSLSVEAWSSDSRHVVCSGYEEGIIVLDTADGTVAQLSDSGSAPSWSPDGTTIAFVDEHKLYVIPAAGGTRRRLGINKVEDFVDLSWSPDSQRVAYVSVEGGDRNSLWTIRADGSGGRRLAQNVAEGTPSWSPDGSHIVFLKYQGHYVRAVYVIANDGTGLHEVSENRGGEEAWEASWSGDGLVLYQRGRFAGSLDSDIYAVSPRGRGGRALTHPFPAGGTNSSPLWITGLHATGAEQLPPTAAARFKRKISFAQPVVAIATDGTRAVPTLAGERLPRLTVWDGVTGRARRGPAPCSGLYGPGSLALAGDRLAWTCSESGNTYYAVGLMTARIGEHRARSVASAAGDRDGGNDIWGLVGHGNTIAFSNHHDGGDQAPSDPWLILTRKATKCPGSGYYRSRTVCRLLGSGRGVTTAVDSGRVVAVTAAGVVRLLSVRGRVLRTWNIGGQVTAFLRGRMLAVQHGTTVDAYDATTGAKRYSRELRTDGGPPPSLLGVQGDLVVYETGGAIHVLRLSDGRDKALRLPGAAPALYARLEPAGLFVSWNKMHDRRPGRLGFIPLRALKL